MPLVRANPIESAPAIGAAPWVSGRYYLLPQVCGTSTVTNSFPANYLLSIPFYVPNVELVLLKAIGAEVTAVGDAGSKVRLGVYTDDGTGHPGELLLDAGTIAGDLAAVQQIAINLPLARGRYFAAAVVQNAPTNAPTLRTHSQGGVIPLDVGVAPPTVGFGPMARMRSGVAGALPDPGGFGNSFNSEMPRMFCAVQ